MLREQKEFILNVIENNIITKESIIEEGEQLTKIVGFYNKDVGKKCIMYINKDNIYHRKNKPALITYFDSDDWKDGIYKYYAIFYFYNGKLHREDGPAYIQPTYSHRDYWLYGKKYSKELWEIKSKKLININKNLKLLNKI